MIKPQFEAGKEFVEKGGVVRDKKVHESVILDVCTCIKELGFDIYGLTHSSIKGPAGNIEYLVWFGNVREGIPYNILDVVEEAHFTLS